MELILYRADIQPSEVVRLLHGVPDIRTALADT